MMGSQRPPFCAKQEVMRRMIKISDAPALFTRRRFAMNTHAADCWLSPPFGAMTIDTC